MKLRIIEKKKKPFPSLPTKVFTITPSNLATKIERKVRPIRNEVCNNNMSDSFEINCGKTIFNNIVRFL